MRRARSRLRRRCREAPSDARFSGSLPTVPDEIHALPYSCPLCASPVRPFEKWTNPKLQLAPAEDEHCDGRATQIRRETCEWGWPGPGQGPAQGPTSADERDDERDAERHDAGDERDVARDEARVDRAR